MLYMSPVDVSRVPLPVHPVHPSEVKLMMSHQGGAMTHQASPPPPYGMNYTTLVPCTQGYPTSVGYHPSQMNLTNNDSEYQSDHSTNHSYITRDSFPIHNGDVCEVWVILNDVIIYDSVNEPKKPTDNSFKLTFFKNFFRRLRVKGHVLIFYPTQVKLSGLDKMSEVDFNRFGGVKNWLIMVKNFWWLKHVFSV